MIRFCDAEIHSVICDDFDVKQRVSIWEYFHDGHEDEIVYLFDRNGKYIGRITYDSLTQSKNPVDSILRERVVLDTDIWENARHFFRYYKDEKGLGKHVLLPVVDQNGELVSFAYDDPDGNREIRMLRELSEIAGTLQFADIYPEYKHVKIYGFNELAFFFAKYLESQNIGIQVLDPLWEGLIERAECQVPEYECLTVYAEGIGEKKQNWRENLLKGVSVEFEYIDEIYERNIECGTIKNAWGDCQEFLEYLRKEKEIVLIGIGMESLDSYDYLIGNGIEVSCFVDDRYRRASRQMFGKEVLGSREVWDTFECPIFIDCIEQNSAWGVGEVDYYDYIGYRRNRNYFLLKDYVEISGNSLINAMKGFEIALLGDVYLCDRLYQYLQQKGSAVIGYFDILSQYDGRQPQLPRINAGYIDKDVMCLLVIPEFFHPDSEEEQYRKKRELILNLEKIGVDSYTDYFSYMLSFIRIEEEVRYIERQLIPKRIVLGSIDAGCGNALFRGVLDNHPSVLMINYSQLNTNLFWICVRLSMNESKDILSLFWKFCEVEGEEAGKIYNPEAFNEKMAELLAMKSKFTSQELFVMVHIAFMYMGGRNIVNMENMLIYWEPHHVTRAVFEECVNWLGSEEVQCDIVNVVRNICMVKGTAIKYLAETDVIAGVWYNIFMYPCINKIRYEQGNRLIVKFEDLKCDPKKTLLQICDKLGLAWSDTLMETTINGKQQFWNNGEREIIGFDLEPVYNTYEKYFSEFDRMRIMLINSPWQRKFGYPYVELSIFSRRELQNMFWKQFRFEDRMADRSTATLDAQIQIQRFIRNRLQKVRMLESLTKREMGN